MIAVPGVERAGPPAALVPVGNGPPLAPLVTSGGLGWGILGAIVASAIVGFLVRHATLRRAIRDAQHSATRDPLTGLANRRLFDEILTRELARARRKEVPVALLLLDLDGFKGVNDTRGHVAGDAVLRTVAQTIAARVRASDLPARLGGDEFAVILPECGTADAQRVGEALCAQIEAAVGPEVTASVGVATVPEHAGDEPGLIAAADAALYEAKSAGRNRTMVAPTPAPPQ